MPKYTLENTPQWPSRSDPNPSKSRTNSTEGEEPSTSFRDKRKASFVAGAVYNKGEGTYGICERVHNGGTWTHRFVPLCTHCQEPPLPLGSKWKVTDKKPDRGVEVENAYFLLRLPKKTEFTKDDIDASGADLLKTSYMHIGDVYYKLDTKHDCKAKPPPPPRPPRPPRPTPPPPLLTTTTPAARPREAPSVEKSLSLLVTALANVQLSEVNEVKLAKMRRSDNIDLYEPQGTSFVSHVDADTWHRTIVVAYEKKDPHECLNLPRSRKEAVRARQDVSCSSPFPPLAPIPSFVRDYTKLLAECGELGRQCRSYPVNEQLTTHAAGTLFAPRFLKSTLSSLFTGCDGSPLRFEQLCTEYRDAMPSRLLAAHSVGPHVQSVQPWEHEFEFELVEPGQSVAMCLTVATDLACTEVVRVFPKRAASTVVECDRIRKDYPRITEVLDLVAFCVRTCLVVVQGAAAGGVVEPYLTTWAITREPPTISIEGSKPTVFSKKVGKFSQEEVEKLTRDYREEHGLAVSQLTESKTRELVNAHRAKLNPIAHGLLTNEEQAKHTSCGDFHKSITDLAAEFKPRWPSKEWDVLSMLGRPIAPSWWGSIPHTPNRQELRRLIAEANTALASIAHTEVPKDAVDRFKASLQHASSILGSIRPHFDPLCARALAIVWDRCSLRVCASVANSNRFRAHVERLCSVLDVEFMTRRAPPLAGLLVKLAGSEEWVYIRALLRVFHSQHTAVELNAVLAEVIRRTLAGTDKAKLTLRSASSGQPRWDNCENGTKAFETILGDAGRIQPIDPNSTPLSHLLPLCQSVVARTGDVTVANRRRYLRTLASELVVPYELPPEVTALVPRARWAVEYTLRQFLGSDPRILHRRQISGDEFVIPVSVLSTL